MSVAVCTRIAAGLVAVTLAVGTAGCGKTSRTGRGSSYLVITSMQAASGAEPSKLGSTLASDVVTLVKDPTDTTRRVPTIYSDNGSVSLRLGMKDVGAPGVGVSPSPNNAITINRYRVDYRRADGRNAPGVDVPYGFDGAVTFTVSSTESPVDAGFVLVRIQAKEEAPLKALAGAGGAVAISTLADVTFYGKDQAGNDVAVTGTIEVDFADWGDPS
jgi:hypothetical protein